MPCSYQIYVKGRLGLEMGHLLADLHPDVGTHSTVLSTDDNDQAALHGTLGRLRNQGLDIDSIWKTEPDEAERSHEQTGQSTDRGALAGVPIANGRVLRLDRVPTVAAVLDDRDFTQPLVIA